VGVSPHNHLVLSLVVPLAGADSHDVRNQSLGSKLEVVGADQICPLPDLMQHMEQLEQGD
jgi:hypothetical protein